MFSQMHILATLASGQPRSLPCSTYLVSPRPAQRRADAGYVQRATHYRVTANNVGLVMATSNWRIIWATPAASEQGVFFFHRNRSSYRLLHTWGGVALPSDRAHIVAWAVNLGVPAPVARCFAAKLIEQR